MLRPSREVIQFMRQQGVAVIVDSTIDVPAQWRGDPDKIFVNIRKVDDYSVLHEYGHILCGYGCCREHDEMKAHGAAVALAHILGVEIDDHSIGRYAGYSVPFGACPEAEKNYGQKEGEGKAQKEDGNETEGGEA